MIKSRRPMSSLDTGFLLNVRLKRAHPTTGGHPNSSNVTYFRMHASKNQAPLVVNGVQMTSQPGCQWEGCALWPFISLQNPRVDATCVPSQARAPATAAQAGPAGVSRIDRRHACAGHPAGQDGGLVPTGTPGGGRTAYSAAPGAPAPVVRRACRFMDSWEFECLFGKNRSL